MDRPLKACDVRVPNDKHAPTRNVFQHIDFDGYAYVQCIPTLHMRWQKAIAHATWGTKA
jgi:hypothetical protein